MPPIRPRTRASTRVPQVWPATRPHGARGSDRARRVVHDLGAAAEPARRGAGAASYRAREAPVPPAGAASLPRRDTAGTPTFATRHPRLTPRRGAADGGMRTWAPLRHAAATVHDRRRRAGRRLLSASRATASASRPEQRWEAARGTRGGAARARTRAAHAHAGAALGRGHAPRARGAWRGAAADGGGGPGRRQEGGARRIVPRLNPTPTPKPYP